MTVRVGINGFGRIGRLVLRAVHETRYENIEIVAINDLGPVATNAHLLRYDSVHGHFPGEVTAGENWIDIGRGRIAVSAERDPVQLPWRSLDVDVALECTGKFTKRAEAAKHIEARGQKGPRFGAGRWRRPDRRHGVNHDRLMSGHKVISNPSCTTSTPRWHTYWKTCPRSHGIL